MSDDRRDWPILLRETNGNLWSSEAKELADYIERLRTVVDAALEWYETDTNDRDATKRLFRQIEKYRALDGEP